MSLNIQRLDPKNDFIFQLLFGKNENKDILIDLLNAILSNDGNNKIIDIEAIENKKLDADKILEWLSADEDTLVTYRLREQSLLEEASLLADAEERGVRKVAVEAIKNGLDSKIIAAITGLTLEEIEKLKTERQ